MGAKLLQDVRQDLADVVQVCEGRKKQTNYLRTLINELVKGGQLGAPGSSGGQLGTHPDPPPGPHSQDLAPAASTEHLPGPCLAFRGSRTEGGQGEAPGVSPGRTAREGVSAAVVPRGDRAPPSLPRGSRTLGVEQVWGCTGQGRLWSPHGGPASARQRGCGH